MSDAEKPVQKVEVHRAGESPAQTIEQDLVVAGQIARLLDSSFEVGGIKFGLDALLGLIPVVGDVASLTIGLYPVHLARKHKLGRLVVLKMLANLGVDFVVGAVPVVGDAADVWIRAHLKNYRLLEDAARKRGGAGPASG